MQTTPDTLGHLFPTPVCISRKTTQPADRQQCLSRVTAAPLPVSLRCPRGQPTHRPWQAELQQPVLHHVDAGVWLARPEDVVTLTEPLEDHVPAELQKEWFLEVAQHPVGWGGGGGMQVR